MAERKLHHAEPGDPDKCEGVTKSGQCMFLSIRGMSKRGLAPDLDPDIAENVRVCPRHDKGRIYTQYKNERLHDYRLQLWQERLDEFAESERAKTLRGEIGILRLTIEAILNQCTTNLDLIMYSTRLSQLIKQLESTVRTCSKMEDHMGMILDQTSAMQFAKEVVSCISQHVKDPAIIDNISNQIIDALTRAVTPEASTEEDLLDA